jgi:hypothetical protein
MDPIGGSLKARVRENALVVERRLSECIHFLITVKLACTFKYR